MNETTIKCPNCETEIPLTESLAAPLINATRKQYESIIAKKDAEVTEREQAVHLQLAEVAKAKASIDNQVAEKLLVERERIRLEEADKAKTRIAFELGQKAQEVQELQEVLKQQHQKLAEAQKTQADFIRKQRDLDDARREIDLTIEQKVQESLGEVRAKAKLEVEEGLKLKLAEKDQQLISMARQIEELRRRSEQGSQQLQGEVQELELESLLRSRFPYDIIEPVPKGEFGGDVIQRVIGPNGSQCGSILWETKRTKNWSEGWLGKLREDQRSAKADVALLLTHALPSGLENFDLVDGVWVTDVRCALPVATALRQSLIEIAGARSATDGQQTKMELIYNYLTGPRFRQRVEAIVEKFSDMQSDLDRERNAIRKMWAKREMQIQGVIESTVGMYGDLQGIAGKSLQEIDGLDTHLLDAPTSDSQKEEAVDC